MFSKACEYAIRASIYIGTKSKENKRVSLVDVSKNIDSPEAFTSKILQKLVKLNLISSIKGPGGGFEIASERLEKITLKNIVETFDGDILNKCSLGLQECSNIQPCPFHNKYKPIKEKLIETFETTYLMDLINESVDEDTYLKL